MLQIESFHLNFQTIVTKQIEDTKLLLHDKWYGLIKNALQRGTKRKHVPDAIKRKSLARFYDSVAALMTQNLSEIVIRSLKMYTNYMCDIGVSTIYTN